MVLVPNDQFRWVRGHELIATWKKPNADWQAWFCSVCGSSVPGENDPAKNVRAGRFHYPREVTRSRSSTTSG